MFISNYFSRFEKVQKLKLFTTRDPWNSELSANESIDNKPSFNKTLELVVDTMVS